VCYEIGVATGELLAQLARMHESKPACRWVGIDRESEMITKAKEHCAPLHGIELYCDDVLSYPFEKSDFIVAYYTMQFIPPRIRQEAFNRIYEALNWGGGFVMFEKVRGPDARFQDVLSQLYHGYKQQQGFSAEEILNKASSLKSVLEPFSTQGNIDLMQRAGFTDIMTIYKNICFEGFLAIK
jgi:tRNA (cmo5U34)-methyltransferase